MADGGPLCAGQVEIGRQSDAGSVKVALRKERAESMQLGKRADDPRILLRAVTAVKEVRRRDLGILIDSGAQDRLAVLIALPGIPCRRAQRSQLLCGKADILAGQPAVGAAEAAVERPSFMVSANVFAPVSAAETFSSRTVSPMAPAAAVSICVPLAVTTAAVS